MKCPRCGSNRVIKAGKTKRKYVARQGYRCKECRRYFIERDGFEHRSYPGKIISMALFLYAQGLSLFNIREFLWQNHGYMPADSTILDWVKTYSKLVEQFERKRMPKPKVKGRIHLDEVELKVGKNALGHKRGRQPDEVQSGLQIHREQEAGGVRRFLQNAQKEHRNAGARGF